MHVYEIAQIEFWNGWMTETEYLRSVAAEFDLDLYRAEDYHPYLAIAKALARQAGWAGKSEPRISAVPPRVVGALSPILIALTEEDSGLTYVVSPFELPWLGAPAASLNIH